MADVLLCDIDGTLVDSNALHAEAWRRAFEHFGIDIGMDQAWSQIGKGGDQRRQQGSWASWSSASPAEAGGAAISTTLAASRSTRIPPTFCCSSTALRWRNSFAQSGTLTRNRIIDSAGWSGT